MGFFDRWFDPLISVGQIPEESIQTVVAQLRFLKVPSKLTRMGNRYFLRVARSRMAQVKPIVNQSWSEVG
jgi:hypothetical protein